MMACWELIQYQHVQLQKVMFSSSTHYIIRERFAHLQRPADEMPVLEAVINPDDIVNHIRGIRVAFEQLVSPEQQQEQMDGTAETVDDATRAELWLAHAIMRNDLVTWIPAKLCWLVSIGFLS